MTAAQDQKSEEFYGKARTAGYDIDVIKMCIIFAFCKENFGHEIETLDKYIELIDKYQADEDNFVKAVGEIFGF